MEKFDPTKGTWEKVSSSVTGTKLAVKNLQEGHEYKFRVKAENLHGLSEPLETDKSIVAKNPYSKYQDIYVLIYLTLGKKDFDYSISNTANIRLDK